MAIIIVYTSNRYVFDVTLEITVKIKTIIAAMLMCLTFSVPAIARSASGKFTMQFDMSNQPKGEGIKLCIP